VGMFKTQIAFSPSPKTILEYASVYLKRINVRLICVWYEFLFTLMEQLLGLEQLAGHPGCKRAKGVDIKKMY
jgi:hypothetical protein